MALRNEFENVYNIENYVIWTIGDNSNIILTKTIDNAVIGNDE